MDECRKQIAEIELLLRVGSRLTSCYLTLVQRRRRVIAELEVQNGEDRAHLIHTVDELGLAVDVDAVAE